jgi:two-component system NarL family sensor kinase
MLDGQVVARACAFACVLALAALSSERADWEPLSLVLALGAVMIVADILVVRTRAIRQSSGMLVLGTVMALLGPAPAVAIAVTAGVIESRLNREPLAIAMTNLVTVTVLGLAGGMLFELGGALFSLDRDDPAYGLLVPPVYVTVLLLNLAMVISNHPSLAFAERLQVVRTSVVPGIPLALANGLIATVAVTAWAYAGLAAAAALLVVLGITVPLTRTLADALRAVDDRDRLLSEVLSAESRERTRLAESLHDGPMQRLIAMRQDMAEGREQDAADLDRAIAETRSIISAYHPATVRELGFESALRAAVAPFPAADSVRLSIRSDVDDRVWIDGVLLPVAQELVVNALKHAAPTAIDVAVTRVNGSVVLQVDDDGVGIDTAVAARAVQAGHVGLAMVRRRVEDARGRLEIAPGPDGGTSSRVILPA